MTEQCFQIHLNQFLKSWWARNMDQYNFDSEIAELVIIKTNTLHLWWCLWKISGILTEHALLDSRWTSCVDIQYSFEPSNTWMYTSLFGIKRKMRLSCCKMFKNTFFQSLRCLSTIISTTSEKHYANNCKIQFNCL